MRKLFLSILIVLMAYLVAVAGPQITRQGGGGSGTLSGNAVGNINMGSYQLQFGGVAISANGISLITAANYAAMRTALGLAIGTDVQAYNANLTALGTLSPVANRLYGVNSGGTIDLISSIVLDNSAAQFQDSVDTTKKAMVSPASMATGKTATILPVGTGDITITTPSLSTGTYTEVFETVTQTLTNKTLTAPSMTPQLVDGSANASPDAAHLSNAIINNYGQSPTSSGTVTVTAPALIAGMNFIMIQGTALTSSGAWRLDGGSGNVYLDGSSTAVQYVTFTAQPISSSLSCFSFKSGGASTYKLKCTTLSGVSVGS